MDFVRLSALENRMGELKERFHKYPLLLVTHDLIEFHRKKRRLRTINGHFQRAKRVFLRRPKTRKQKILKLFFENLQN